MEQRQSSENPVLDVLYAVSALWGGLPSQVCPASASGIQRMAPVGSQVTAFVGVNVIPMDAERVLVDQTVLIESGRIAALGPSSQVQVPAKAVRVDGRGKYLIPGLADMHAHGGFTEEGIPAKRNSLFSSLATGVTAIRWLDGANMDPQTMQQYFEAAEVPIPRLYFAPKIATKQGNVAAHVAAAGSAGYRHITTPFDMSTPFIADDDPRAPEARAAFDSLVAAARRAGLPLSSHSHRFPFDMVLAIGTTGGSVEHLSGVFWDTLGLWSTYTYTSQKRKSVDIPSSKLPPLIAAVQRAGIWITPTLACMEGSHTHVKGMPQIVKALQDAGVKLLMGSDKRPAHEELAALVRAGLTPYQALLTSTRNPAQYLGLLDSSGTVAVNKWADLVLLHGNPLTDIQHTREPAGVMIAGRWLDRAALGQPQRTP